MNHYETNLDKNSANFVPLTPLSFLERAKDIYPNYEAVVYESRKYTWSEVYKRCIQFASALEKIGIKTGDTVKVNVKVSEGNRERIQTYEGVVISLKGVTVNKTITVRKLSFGVGVERIFPIHAPIIDSIEVTRKGKVRRSKLYYLRDRIGKSAKIKEDRTT